MNVKKVPEISLPTEDYSNLTSQESSALASGDLEKEAAQNHHKRKEQFKNHFHWIWMGIMWIAATAFIFMFVVFIIHTSTPWSFLTTQQLEVVKSIIFSSFVSSLLTTYAKQYLKG